MASNTEIPQSASPLRQYWARIGQSKYVQRPDCDRIPKNREVGTPEVEAVDPTSRLSPRASARLSRATGWSALPPAPQPSHDCCPAETQDMGPSDEVLAPRRDTERAAASTRRRISARGDAASRSVVPSSSTRSSAPEKVCSRTPAGADRRAAGAGSAGKGSGIRGRCGCAGGRQRGHVRA